MDFSFMNFELPTTNGVTNSGTDRASSERQVKYYLDLCIKRNVEPKEASKMSFDEVNALIEEMKNHNPASEAQRKLVTDKVVSLQTMGVTIQMPDLDKLTGGREGTASKLIEQLIEMERQQYEVAPPSDNQLLFIVNMYLCPDVGFEEHGIERRIELEGGEWRKYTPNEFAEQVKAKMTRKTATSFIEKYRGAFHTWKQTRIKLEQQRYIRQLEARMADVSSPTVQEWSVDEEGNLVQISRPLSRNTEHLTSGYKPLDDMELMMFSAEEASKHIDILKSELENKELYKFGEKSDGKETFEEIRKPCDMKGQKNAEYKTLQDLMYKLEAVAGYNDEELHEAVTYLLVEDGCEEVVKGNKAKIKDFMISLIEEDHISLEGMAELVRESDVAQKILLGV